MIATTASATAPSPMVFDLESWLRKQTGAYALDIPLIDVSNKQADEQREWLVTNGLGSFASGNIWGANSRRYHGLGIFAVDPPVGRTALLSHIDELADGQPLSTNFWTSGAVSPQGYLQVVAFTIYPVPTWVFDLGHGYLVKQVAMLPNKQEVLIGYTWQGSKPLELGLNFLCNCRDFHGETKGWIGWQFKQTAEAHSVYIKAWDAAPELAITFSDGIYVEQPQWYWDYYWPREAERGLGAHEDLFHAGQLNTTLEPGKSLTIRAGLESQATVGDINHVVKAIAAHHNRLVEEAGAPSSQDARRLIVAADQFVVERRSTASASIVAGYHWFCDWGRDSMISLPGLTLSTGRPQVAAGILMTFGVYLNRGMLPNNFPDAGAHPEYNTIDATLWWAWALHHYHQKTGDRELVSAQLPLLDEVVRWHQNGTRYGIHVDQSDGLLSSGDATVQLTWMDAKVGDYVVTPRTGKAVEINALWYNFLKILEHLHHVAGSHGSFYGAMAEKARQGFSKFWNGIDGCLYDVITDDGISDASIRPNQLLAISLPYKLVTDEQAKSILFVVERDLLTPKGLRTLSPRDPAYRGHYGGRRAVANQYDRDVTYHQGTVWPWLFGPWVDARINVFGRTDGNRELISAQLAPIKRHVLNEAGLGTVSEIFDGDIPYVPRGCIAQAWSVAELLRVILAYDL